MCSVVMLVSADVDVTLTVAVVDGDVVALGGHVFSTPLHCDVKFDVMPLVT